MTAEPGGGGWVSKGRSVRGGGGGSAGGGGGSAVGAPDPDPASRIADALADLADTLTGFRGMLEREEARLAADREADEDRDARRAPARRLAAVRELQDAVRGVVHEASQPGRIAPDEHTLADQIVAALDKRLRSSWGLRDAFRTLGAAEPPEDLTAVAREKALNALGTAANPEELDRWTQTWLSGALYDLRG